MSAAIIVPTCVLGAFAIGFGFGVIGKSLFSDDVELDNAYLRLENARFKKILEDVVEQCDRGRKPYNLRIGISNYIKRELKK